MITHSPVPALLEIGPFEIRFYGIVYVLGFVLSYYFVKKKMNFSEKELDSLMTWSIAGLLAGSRLFHFVFNYPSVLLHRPWEFFMIWKGGMSFFGGFVGLLVSGYFFLKDKRPSLVDVADVVVVPASLTLVLGRIANFLNAELVGVPTDVPWCVQFTNVDNLCRHPYPLYASFSHLVLFVVLYWLSRKNPKRGVVFYTFMAVYGILRFITDFFIDLPRFLGLTIWQYMAFGLSIAGIYFLNKTFKR